QKTILDSLNGKFKPGRLVSPDGPSGAGKSSLTNVLAGYISKNVEGDILVNGQIRNLRKFRKNSCYIMQEDLLLPHLSVYESMTCSANLRLCEPPRKRRPWFGPFWTCWVWRMQLHQGFVSDGLDSASCFQCVSLLKELALGGRTIVCTIHQPSAKLFEMFDQLYFPKGRCLYNGPAGAVVPYLASRGFVCPSYHNPTDYFMEAVCGDDSTTPVGDAGEDSATTDGDQQKGERFALAKCAEFMRAYKSAVAKEKADAAILADNASATSSSSSSANSNKNPDQSLANNDSDSNANESSVKDDSRYRTF
uniref:ABC transporter domain-containing protein n=1 Tax=Macrostomum lignano TaxID=282301 RepID=A0A1I8JS07_9PLAT